ncbi:unnamed protein product [Allacma fusca]|uniref:Uncharacterized protein n=1 Tax=Allacma fusca TaxID=39272 RepID=A0A8J2LV24_9HEXA|nr:unnamed protein product [Allacma fusca]
MKFLGSFALLIGVGSSLARIIYSNENESNEVPSSGQLSASGLEKPDIYDNDIQNLEAEESPKNTLKNSTLKDSLITEIDNDDSATPLSAVETSGGVEENSVIKVEARNIPTMNVLAQTTTTENSLETDNEPKSFTVPTKQNKYLQRRNYSSTLDFNYDLEKSESSNNNIDSQDFLAEDASSKNVTINVNKAGQGDDYLKQNENSSLWIAQFDPMSNSTVTLKEEFNNSTEGTLSFQGTKPPVNGTTKKSLCKSQENISSQEFEDFVYAMGLPSPGDSLIGPHPTQIAQNVRGDGEDIEYVLTIEISNYMNRSIASFQVLDQHNASYFTPPELIHPKAKEVFMFYEPSCCFPFAAFSFEIMGTETRLVAYGESSYFKALGLAFLPEGVSLQQYYSNKAKFGEYLLMWQTEKVRSINVGKDNFHARATMSGAFNCVVKIEIIEVPKC